MRKKIFFLIVLYVLFTFTLFPLSSHAESSNSMINFLFGLKQDYYQYLYDHDLLKPNGFERFGGWWDPLGLYEKDPEFRRKSDEGWELMKPFMDALSTLKRKLWDEEIEKIKKMFPWFFPPDMSEGSTMPEGYKWKLFHETIQVDYSVDGKSYNFSNFYDIYFNESDHKQHVISRNVKVKLNSKFLRDFWGWGSQDIVYTTPFTDPFHVYYYDFKKDEKGIMCFCLLDYDKETNSYYDVQKLRLTEENCTQSDDFDDPDYNYQIEFPKDGYMWQPDWSKLPNVKKYVDPDGRVWYSVDENTMFQHARDLPMIQVPDGEGYDVYYDKQNGRFILVPQGADFPPLLEQEDGTEKIPEVVPDQPNDPGQSDNPDQPNNPDQPSNPDQPPKILEPPTEFEKQKQSQDIFDAITSIEFNPQIKKRDWKGKFPFCIPFDIFRIIKSMAVSPKSIDYKINFSIFGAHVDYVVDFTPFDKLIKLVRFFFILSFVFTLIGWTRTIAKW